MLASASSDARRQPQADHAVFAEDGPQAFQQELGADQRLAVLEHLLGRVDVDHARTKRVPDRHAHELTMNRPALA